MISVLELQHLMLEVQEIIEIWHVNTYKIYLKDKDKHQERFPVSKYKAMVVMWKRKEVY